MLKVVICEDDIYCREFLKQSLLKIFKESKKHIDLIEFNSGEALLKDYPEKVDIFLLDIEMDKLTGMDVAREIRKVDKDVEIIFTTGSLTYIQEGYEVRAYRYLIKPFAFEELNKHISSCIKEIVNKREGYVIIQEKNNIYKISIHEITYIEVYKKDITIHTLNKRYQSKMSITNIEKELDKYDFFRCHRSYLVNMEKVEYLKCSTIVINKEEIPISRYRINEFKDKLSSTLGGILC